MTDMPPTSGTLDFSVEDDGGIFTEKEEPLMQRNPWLCCALCAAYGIIFNSSIFAEAPYQAVWARQIGTTGTDFGSGIAVDTSGNAFVSGYTTGNIARRNSFFPDAFLAKYDSTGNLLWARQFGTPGDELCFSVAVNSAGDAYISGTVNGNLNGGPHTSSTDAFLTKYDGDGNLLWFRQIGTSVGDNCFSVAVDNAGNALISGVTDGSLGGPHAGNNDGFVSKFDASGNLLWSRQIGTPGSDNANAVAVDAFGNAYVSGYTFDSLAAPYAGNGDAYIIKYDPSGNLLWSKQIGTIRTEFSYAVTVDSAGNALISGYTFGDIGGPNAGEEDAFLIKFDPDGQELWSRQIGTANSDLSFSVVTDSLGNAFISGCTKGNLGGTNAGDFDAFLSKYDSSGNFLWSQQFGTSALDQSRAAAVDPLGNLYLSGVTYGDLAGPNAGAIDTFIVKYAVPEPSTFIFVVLFVVATPVYFWRSVRCTPERVISNSLQFFNPSSAA
jgi:hypothetical protein